MTLAIEVAGWICVVVGLGGVVAMREGALGVGASGAILLGLAYAGAFNGF